MESLKNELKRMIDYQEKAIVSKQIIKKPNGNITLFALDKDEFISEHTSPYEALVQVIEGKMKITVGGQNYNLEEGEIILLPSNISHGLVALEKSKVLLTMII